MALRDHGVIDYYIPLFAGTTAARLGRWRLFFPPDIYAPYIPGTGGIGTGDGGFDTPVDPTIDTPVITYPNLEDYENVSACASATSSAFSSTNGQTHIASRWFIELLDLGGSLSPLGVGGIVFDSFADFENLTELALDMGLAYGASYRITVRYKGSNGGWSDFADPVSFITADCPYICDGDEAGDPEVTEEEVPATLTYQAAWTGYETTDFTDGLAACQLLRDQREEALGFDVTPGGPTFWEEVEESTQPCWVGEVIYGYINRVYLCPEEAIAESSPDPAFPRTCTIEVINGGEPLSHDCPPDIDPPDGEPEPPPAPEPVPPAPTPAPTPAPAPGEPVTPTPPANILLDLGSGSYLSSVDSSCSFMIPLSWAIRQHASSGGGSSMALQLRFQNLSPTPGIINYAVRADDGRMVITSGAGSVSVPGNGFGIAIVTLFTAVENFGGYTVEIEDSNGNIVEFQIDMGGAVPSLNGFVLGGPSDSPSGNCPETVIGAGD